MIGINIIGVSIMKSRNKKFLVFSKARNKNGPPELPFVGMKWQCFFMHILTNHCMWSVLKTAT